MKVLLDTNIMVDVLQRREPWFEDGAYVFRAVANNVVTGCLTTKQIADLHFFSRKVYKGRDNVDAKARQIIGKLFALFHVIDTLAVDCQNALSLNNGDYEDAILIESAVRAGVDCIITRDLDHFKLSPIPVFSLEAFAAELKKQYDAEGVEAK